MNYHDFFKIFYITLYITLVFGVAETYILQGFQTRLISVRLPYRVPIRMCSFNNNSHILFLCSNR